MKTDISGEKISNFIVGDGSYAPAASLYVQTIFYSYFIKFWTLLNFDF